MRLRPAPHTRTPIHDYHFQVSPDNHRLYWQQDPFGNTVARVIFPERVEELKVAVRLVAEMTVINPFDFFLEPESETFPFTYDDELKKDLAPYLAVKPAGEWNRYQIIMKDTHLVVFLNGELIQALDLSRSAMKDRPRSGRISFQDEAKVVSYKNIRIKELK